MKDSFLFLANGFEEIEALTCVDILRRAGIPVKTVSITDSQEVTGANGIRVLADVIFDNVSFDSAPWLICPGGMPGAENLFEFKPLGDLLKKQAKSAHGRIAAICAAPAVVLGQLGLLKGQKATCYPGFEELLAGSILEQEPVVQSGKFILGDGPAHAMIWALAIVGATLGENASRQLAGGLLLYPRSDKDIDFNFG